MKPILIYIAIFVTMITLGIMFKGTITVIDKIAPEVSGDNEVW